MNVIKRDGRKYDDARVLYKRERASAEKYKHD